ncbi:MAG: DUF6516 family protein [Candidatus Methanoperedens sp.]|nr:DUF6516 family protein [Candidatus Methanoperedens sp.]
MISDYFDFLKKIANKNPDVVKFRLIKEFMHLHKIDYSYHWQNNEKKLIKRWDNAPHHAEIETFPHHLHNGEDIMPSTEPTFVEILKKVGEKIYKT